MTCQKYGVLAQLERAPLLRGGGRGFESHIRILRVSNTDTRFYIPNYWRSK